MISESEFDVAQLTCPACGILADGAALEVFHQKSLYACANCDLHFWHPVVMPDPSWYERAYQGRDQKEMPLEPGHLFFLKDPRAPKNGRLLDLGCGVGNFVAAARGKGFRAVGVEPDRNAVHFAKKHYRLSDVWPVTPEYFCETHLSERFDVVTFFEVLEHQQNPLRFLNIAKKCLTDSGYIAISVPNRNRWQKGIETLDYPPNHLTRWSPNALQKFLVSNGFEVLSMCEEPLGARRAAQVLSAGLRTGMVRRVAGETPPTLADLADMAPAEIDRTLARADELGHRLAARLSQLKNWALLPAAAVLLPYFRLRGYRGLYLYCLARLK